jgi:hypothetical protein
MGVQVYLTASGVRGRLIIDPARIPGAAERDHHFVVHGHDFLELMPPSPLAGLGLVRFFDATDAADLTEMLIALAAPLAVRPRSAPPSIPPPPPAPPEPPPAPHEPAPSPAPPVDALVPSLDLPAPSLDLPSGDLPPDDLFGPNTEDMAPIRPRLPRTKVALAARLEIDGLELEVQLLDANAGGVFAAIHGGSIPSVGTELRLTGCAPLWIRARVAHVRSQEEADLFDTQPGVGLAYVPPAALEAWQSGPLALLLAPPGPARDRALGALADGEIPALCADHLVAAAIWLFHARIAALLIDESFLGGAWADAIAALDAASEVGVVGLLGDASAARPPLPRGVVLVDRDRIDHHVVRSLLGV